MANGIDQQGDDDGLHESSEGSCTEAIATAKAVANHQAGRHWIGITSIRRHDYFVRKKSFTGWKQGNTPEKNFETPAFGGGFFLTSRLPF